MKDQVKTVHLSESNRPEWIEDVNEAAQTLISDALQGMRKGLDQTNVIDVYNQCLRNDTISNHRKLWLREEEGKNTIAEVFQKLKDEYIESKRNRKNDNG